MASEAQLNTLQQLYIAYFGRPAEPSGVTYWEGRIDAGMSLDDVANAFTTADEFVAAYGDDTAALVRAAYENALGREVESEEALNFWVNQLDSGAVTPADLMNSFFGTSDATDLAVLNNRTEVAKAYTAAAGANYDAAASKTLLASVDDTQASVDAALEQVGQVPAETPNEALENLQNAQETLDASVEAAAAADDDAPDADDAGYDSFIDAYTAADARAELGQAQTALFSAQSAALTAQQNLASARATTSDAKLDQNLATALNAVKDNAALQTLLQTRDAANARLAADIAADGSNQELLSELRAAIGSYVSAGGSLSVVVDSTSAETIGGLLDDLNTALTVSDPITTAEQTAIDGLVDTVGEYTGFAPAAGNATAQAIKAALDAVVQRDTLAEAADTAQTGVEDEAGLDAVQAAEEAIAARDLLIDANAQAQTTLENAETYFEQFSSLVEAIEAAEAGVQDAIDAFEELGFEAPITVDGPETGTVADDIFVVGSTDGSIAGFNALGDDLLYVGQGFSLVQLGDEVVADKAVGSASVLEVFVQQNGNDAVVYVENQAFNGSETDGDFNGTTITLVGVSADDLSFQNGFLTVADSVA